MPISFRRVSLVFDSSAGSEQVETATVTFNSKVKTAQAALRGFDVRYDHTDRELKHLKVDLDNNTPVIKGASVAVTGRLLLHDNSGNIDDPYSGRIDVLVIADVE
jgi:hypothetical protein